jgi:asparagine synthase (glutamine-hydrolysing)
MCGIAGLYHYADLGRQVDRNLLVRMTRMLAHRGPDDERFHFAGPIGLGHRRLAIVDLSPTGSQPMPNEARSCWLAYNGEFYNHTVHRERLVSRGISFRGTSDTETLLKLFDEEGPSCLSEVAGIFAFAFWDGRRKHLTLVRDPLGVKQLYFHDDGRRIVFASEIKALLICPDVPREPDPEAVNQYLHFHTPLFERTFFRHVRQVRPGEYIRITPHGACVAKYWAIDDFSRTAATPAKRVEELRQRLAAIVREQLMSDVPVGSFFSAGIDSSAVAAYAAKSDKPPECFGVHFSGQGVPDERPYQEAAAKHLGLKLHLITSDGRTFPEDMRRLMYHQDQPVIGSAMFPMYYVSRLAAKSVKVCLGGQAADEIFGGYARYALTRPASVLRSWFTGRQPTNGEGAASRVGGNLGRQLWDRRNLRRLYDSVVWSRNWQDRYFHHFAKVPEPLWRNLFAAPEFINREQCREVFRDTLRRSAAVDPADKAMHWDVQTYLTGLFQQDDRMSMAVSLESRVPLADPRLVRFAFQTPFDVKFRGGATKWILRQAVSDVLPEMVLNRRKVGFDTPVETWMKTRHRDFVRDTLLSRRCQSRGILDPRAIAELLANADAPLWIDMVWKALSIETWAQVFLDDAIGSEQANSARDAFAYQVTPDPKGVAAGGANRRVTAGNLFQEIREMGIRGAIARAAWELKMHSGIPQLASVVHSLRKTSIEAEGANSVPKQWLFADPKEVADAIGPRIPAGSLARLCAQAREATRGRILSFDRWFAEYGSPIDWHRNPHNGHRWRSDRHWSKALGNSRAGDVKLIWEPARYPHAYLLGRAAVLHPLAAEDLYNALTLDIKAFIEQNRVGYGIHSTSGQEIAIRCLAWVFSLNAFSRLGCATEQLERLLRRYFNEAGEHITAHIEFARDSIPNNHLISEALGLYLLGAVSCSTSKDQWQEMGRTLLCDAAERQFYPEGAYLQNSHNYHRSVLQLYLCAFALTKERNERPAPTWLSAMERSLDFLVAHQNPADGRLPNYGANDGAMPCILSCCDFSDYRPLLQAVSIACRNERIYEPGPWDEESAWLLGPAALSTPLRLLKRKSVSFRHTGYHTLRGKDETTFAAFRCGSLLTRFSQMDMLHLDVWWRGCNVLVDGGSYLYNGPGVWHNHLQSTSSHNTVVVDGRDQMVQFRRFKNLYWTKAALLRFEDTPDFTVAEGERYAYRRYPGECVHKRSVLFVKDDLWIVADSIRGSGSHQVRLHWLGGPFPYEFDSRRGELALETSAGRFTVRVLDEMGQSLSANVAAGQEEIPRGWLSRSYGEKVPAPSLAAELNSQLPAMVVTVMSGGSRPEIEVANSVWTVRSMTTEVIFRIQKTEIDYTELVVRSTARPMPASSSLFAR